MVCADTAVCVAANAKAARGAMFRIVGPRVCGRRPAGLTRLARSWQAIVGASAGWRHSHYSGQQLGPARLAGAISAICTISAGHPTGLPLQVSRGRIGPQRLKNGYGFIWAGPCYTPSGTPRRIHGRPCASQDRVFGEAIAGGCAARTKRMGALRTLPQECQLASKDATLKGWHPWERLASLGEVGILGRGWHPWALSLQRHTQLQDSG
jgi:hypothetical protein